MRKPIHINYAVVFIATIFLSACSAKVITANAPVDRGNINSLGATLGSIYRVNLNNGRFIKTTDELTAQNYFSKPGKINQQNKGTLEVGFSRGVKIEFSGIPEGIEATAKADITDSISFKMIDFKETETVYSGEDILNSKEFVNFRQNQKAYANDNYRYVFIRKSTTAKTVETYWGSTDEQREKVNGGNVEIKVGTVNVTVNGGFSSAFKCSGVDNQCVIVAEVLKLVPNPNPSGATGYKFVSADDVASDRNFFYEYASN